MREDRIRQALHDIGRAIEDGTYGTQKRIILHSHLPIGGQLRQQFHPAIYRCHPFWPPAFSASFKGAPASSAPKAILFVIARTFSSLGPTARGCSHRGRMPAHVPEESSEDHYLKLDDQGDIGMLLSSSIPAILIS